MKLPPRNLAQLCAVTLAGLLIAPTAVAQSQPLKPWEFPPALRPSLDARLHLFMQAQAEGHWDEVGQLLGTYRRTTGTKTEYTPIHKACLISQMRTSPMTSFDFTVGTSTFSSEILSTPLSSKWWTLTGEGVFGSGAEVVKKKAWVVAYRDRGDWYFTPQTFDDNAWALQHTTLEDLNRDHGKEVKVLIASNSPLKVVDLHVFLDAGNMASRKISFRLQNRTRKQVRAYSFEISDDRHDGGITVGTSAPQDAIAPLGRSRQWEEDASAYTFWCEGASQISIELQDVWFADGTYWEPQKSSK